MTKSVLVLGGTAFVGRAVLEALIASGYMVDFVTRGQRKVDVTGYRTHHICDRTDEQALSECIAGVHYDYVFDISAYTRHDIEVVLHVIETSKLQRYVFLSSGAVYLPSQQLLHEHSLRGANPHWGRYGLDKREAEDVLFENKYNVPVTIFRPPYIYGEGNELYRESYFFQQVEKGEAIPYPATDKRVQFVHIDDVVRMMLAAVTNEQAENEAYHLAHPEEVTWEKLVRTCTRCAGETQLLPVSVEEMALLQVTAKQFFPFRDVMYKMCTDKLREHGLPQPRIGLEEGLRRSYDWFTRQAFQEPTIHAMNELARVTAYCLQRERNMR
ncbi:NAD-dependent epimerase/dehydratase family protein [Bacillus sp. FSL W7-1360]